MGRVGLVFLIALLLLAAWFGQVVIVILIGLALSAAGLARLWSRVSLVGIDCQRSLSEHRLFPGESIELKLRVVNRKLLPLPWIQVDDQIPLSFAPDVPLTPADRPGFGLLSKGASLLWYTAVNWRQRLYCNRRGYYPLGPISVTSGDIFGFYPRSLTFSPVDHVIVYPRIFPITGLDVPSLYPLGETSARHRICQDQSRTIGIRDYNPGDSLRSIHWKASARRQSLQVKVFEPTTTVKAELFLVVDSFWQESVHHEEDFELGISTAASLANYLVERGSSVGLLANSRQADSGQAVSIPPSSNTGQLIAMLEALAKVTPSPSEPFAQFLQHERRSLPSGTTLIFVLSRASESLTGLFTSLKETGYKLLVLQIGNDAGGRTDHTVAWHDVRRAGDGITTSSEAVR